MAASFVRDCLCVFTGNGGGFEVGLHGNAFQTSVQAGLVAFPAWVQSESILEIAAITALSEAFVQEFVLVGQVSLGCHSSFQLLLAQQRCWSKGHTVSKVADAVCL